MPTDPNLSPAVEAGKRIGDVKSVPGGGSYAVLGQGDQVKDLEFLLDHPRRIKQMVQAHDVASFNAYFNKFKGTASVIFADRTGFTVSAVIDYHHPADGVEELPHWCSHRVVYTAPRSPEWETWTGHNNKRMTQADFALFIENNVADIRTPAGSDVLEVARNLQAKKAVDFSSAIRIATGEQQFTYSETVDGSARNGQLKVPEEFTLGIPVFRNDAAYEVRARLRYRIDGGKLALWYDLYRPEAIEADAFGKIVDAVELATATQVWQGHAG